MKTNIECVYRKMKPQELAGIAFGAIGERDIEKWKACEAAIRNKTYVGRDLDFSRTLQNQIDFCILAGFQFHKYAYVYASDSIIERGWSEIASLEEAGTDLQTIDERTQTFFHLAVDAGKKFQIILFLMNTLCNRHELDKHSCLAIAEINLSVRDLENVELPDPKQWSDDVQTFHKNFKFIFEATLNPKVIDDGQVEV